MNNLEIFITVIVILMVLCLITPSLYNTSCRKYKYISNSDNLNDYNLNSDNSNEYFSSTQEMEPPSLGVDDYNEDDEGSIGPKWNNKDYESLIYDNETGTIMTGSQFMRDTNLIAPPWIAPAWDPNAVGPSSKGEINPDDYENDERMIYNKCSLSCCSKQYQTPFQGSLDPLVYDENGNTKYLSSNYTCQNNTGRSGCLCMTPNQVPK